LFFPCFFDLDHLVLLYPFSIEVLVYSLCIKPL
jgi:hypothetical protein